MREGLLSEKEQGILNLLADAWNEFAKLDPVHPDEAKEFCLAIHLGQQIIMSRPVMKEMWPNGRPRRTTSDLK